MAEISKEVDKTLTEYIQEVEKHLKLKKAVIFGSYAKGNFREDSDVDVAIFSDTFEGKSLIEINTLLFSLARKFKNICIEPIGFDSSELNNGNPFIKEILKNGREINP